MNAGYVRLSKDDNHKNYVSIENQKLIIEQFAATQGVVIDRWYEDDGISGYIFDRPGFQQMMADLEKDIDAVYVKDFSRLGRHNAKILLLLDEFKEREKHLIVIDDNYDSMNSSDDMIGIKTWFNERYVKDTSKKIKGAIEARQKEGTLITQPPFGYRRNKQDKTLLEIVPQEAEYIKLIFELYISGFGYRKIANQLTMQDTPTPSMIRHKRELEENQISKRVITTKWTDGMVKNLLDNDFYTGTLRLKKRMRSTVHGKDKRIPKEDQYIFENHHPAIIDQATFTFVQELKEKRNRINYRGSRGQWINSEILNPFGNCLFCKNCENRLTPIRRKTTYGERKYYICTTYNTKGKRYCSKSHLIEETDLMTDILAYIKICRATLCESIATYNLKDFETKKETIIQKSQKLQSNLSEKKTQLKIVLTQKVKDLATAHGNEKFINEIYDTLQKDLLTQIHNLEIQMKKLNEITIELPDMATQSKNALEVIDKIIAENCLDQRDIDILIEKIIVDEEGLPEIILKHNLSNLILHSPANEMNHEEHTIIFNVMKLISEDPRDYTSAKYLSERITDLGFKKTNKSILPYIKLMKNLGILESTENPLKPYMIIKDKKEILSLSMSFPPNLLKTIIAK